MTRLSQWLKESLFRFPSVVQPPSDSVVVATEPFNQINQASSDPSQRNNKITSPVSVLMNHRCPHTVSGFVVSFVADSLNAPPILSRSHVLKEGSKRFSPSLANLNATAAVILVVFLFGVCASGNQTSPDSIRSGSFSSTSLTMLDVNFESGTTARCSKSTADCVIPSDYYFTAITEPVASAYIKTIGSSNGACRSNEGKTFVRFSGSEHYAIHGSIQEGGVFWMIPRRVADSAVSDSTFKQAEIATRHLVPASISYDDRHSFRWESAPVGAMAVAMINSVLRFSGFLGDSLRHNVFSKFRTLCLVAGDWRQPITRYDYE